jgi:chaperone required for assembly of F1-ATPase
MTIRDIFSELFANEPLEPGESARRSMRNLPKKFYAAAGIGEADGAFRILLDGRPARTPARHFLAAPTPALGEALAAEWDAQEKLIDPAGMPLTRLANSIIDGVATSPGPVAAEVAKFLGSDLLFYRAENPDRLVARESAEWDPVLAWARETLGANFMLSAGIRFVAQPETALARARAAIPRDAWRLGAVLLALAVLREKLSAEDAWRAAHVDEDFNFDTWGRDEDALARRAARFAEMQAAATVLRTAE